MNEIINIGVGTDVKLTARLVDAQGNAINLNQVTELRAVIYNGDRQRTLSDYNIVDDTSVEFVLRSGTELTAGDQVAISMAIRYKKEGFVNSTPIIEIIHRGWVGEEITPMAMPMAVVNSAITAQFTISVPPAVYYAGASPRIGANGRWYVFDDVTKDYVDTGFGANLSNEQIIADETERRRQEAIRVAAEIQREVRMRQVEDKVNNVGENLRYLREDVDARISPTVDGVEMKGSDDADQIVKLSLSTKDARPKFVRNNTPKELALKDDVDDVSNNKFDKSKVLPAYPSAEPTDDTGVISAKQQYKKDKEQADKMFQLEQEVNGINYISENLMMQYTCKFDSGSIIRIYNYKSVNLSVFFRKGVGNSDGEIGVTIGANTYKEVTLTIDCRNIYVSAAHNFTILPDSQLLKGVRKSEDDIKSLNAGKIDTDKYLSNLDTAINGKDYTGNSSTLVSVDIRKGNLVTITNNTASTMSAELRGADGTTTNSIPVTIAAGLSKDVMIGAMDIKYIYVNTYPYDFSINTTQQPNDFALTKTHHILLVSPEGENYSCLIGGEDAYSGGYMVECCSWDAFVYNAEKWKYEVDACVFFNLQLGCDINANASQIEAAMLIYRNAGCKFLFTNIYDCKLKKYAQDGTITEVNIGSTVLYGLSLHTAYDVTDGVFAINGVNTFSESIIRDETPSPNSQMYSYKSTDVNTIFPVVATKDGNSMQCTAYKPNSFFAYCYGGQKTGFADSSALYKYIKLNIVLDALLGKPDRTRIAFDLCNGKKIAASGFDGDCTTEIEAAQALKDAVGYNRPCGFSLYAQKMTSALAGQYRGIKGLVSLVSHTDNHFNERETITDELHVIGSDYKIRLNKTIRSQIISVKSSDGTITYTLQNAPWNKGLPTGNQYRGDTITISPIELTMGYLVFPADKVGESIKVTYSTIVDDYKEIVGSIETLAKAGGAITDKAVYLTGGTNGTHPYTAMMAAKEDIVLCDHQNGTNYNRASFYARLRMDKFTIPVASMFKIDASNVIRDSYLFKNDRAYNDNTVIPKAIAYSNKYNLPFEWYDHDLIIAKDFPLSVWSNPSGWHSSWKQSTYEETKNTIKNMYASLYNKVDEEGVYWMFREDCCRRLDYITKYIYYDVRKVGNTTYVTIENRGNKAIEGLTFRSPSNSDKSVLFNDKINYKTKYANGELLIWFDVNAGNKINLRF